VFLDLFIIVSLPNHRAIFSRAPY